MWTIKGLAPCSNMPDEVVIVDALNVTPAFKASPVNGCGVLKVTFTNTSAAAANTAFLWNFGDGSTSTEVSPVHTFQPAGNGKDTVYTTTLTVTNNCLVTAPASQNITVSPAKPVVKILPVNLTGCVPFVVDVRNLSPGTNANYTFYLYDGSTLVQKIIKTDKSDAVFDALSPKGSKTYIVYMVAANSCGTTAESEHIPVTVSPPNITPQFFIQNNVTSGCTPLPLTLINNSAGGNRFTYNIYDSNGKLINTLTAGTANYNYTITAPGSYAISITAADDCSPAGVESAKQYVQVYPVPAPAFKSDVNSGCDKLTVAFTNQTPDAKGTPATSLNYTWDFGDGTPQSNLFAPTHTYTVPGTYSVTLIAGNTATSCSNTATLSNYIHIIAPPATDFKVEPDTVITIPNYRFSFADESTGEPVKWLWNFGDGSTSSSRNPAHTYADTGRYTVTLITSNASGCQSSRIRHVAVTGTPGQLYVPNAFIPTSATEELRTFKAKGSGIKAYHLQIFNNYGQLVWETTKLSSRGEPVEGWDGTFKGSPVPQGVYIWQMSASFINGTDWKGMSYNNSSPKTVGPIHLIR